MPFPVMETLLLIYNSVLLSQKLTIRSHVYLMLKILPLILTMSLTIRQLLTNLLGTFYKSSGFILYGVLYNLGIKQLLHFKIN